MYQKCVDVDYQLSGLKNIKNNKRIDQHSQESKEDKIQLGTITF